MRSLPSDPFSKVAVTGAGGQLGSRLVEALHARGHEVIALDRTNFDLSRPAELSARLDALAPTLIFHAGAYTQVDLAEKERDLCEKVNTEATARIAEWSEKSGMPLVYFSTDYVFGGNQELPYVTEAEQEPLNWYGTTKANAEKALLTADAHSLIIRTQWVYDHRGKNFLRTVLRLLAEKPELRIVNDQFGAPTFAADLAESSIELAEVWLDWALPGRQIRHVTNAGTATWYEFAVLIRQYALERKILEKPGQLIGIPSSEYPTPAARPRRSLLDLHETLRDGVRLRHWDEALSRCLDEMKDLK